MEKREIIEKIEELKDLLNRAFYMRNSVFALIRCLFLKYATDNFVGGWNAPGGKGVYERMKEMFEKCEFIKYGPNILVEVFSIIGQQFGSGIDQILMSASGDFAEELFAIGHDYRRNGMESACKRVASKLAEIDLEEHDGDHSVGKLLVECIKNYLGNADYRNVTGVITNKTAAELAGKILRVEDGEKFLDFASGIGLSTLTIVENDGTYIINSDVEEKNLALAVMLYIMRGYGDFKIENKSYDALDTTSPVDKIFVDPPFGGRMRTSKGDTIDSVSCAVNTALDFLDVNNPRQKMVLAVSSNFLFSAAKPIVNVKKRIIADAALKAIIALPLNVPGTGGVTINFIVLSMEKSTDVTFVNACGREFQKYVTKSKIRETSVSKEGIDLIANIVNGGVETRGIAVNVPYYAVNFENMLPANYVKEERETGGLTVAQIDERLAELYNRLGIKK